MMHANPTGSLFDEIHQVINSGEKDKLADLLNQARFSQTHLFELHLVEGLISLKEGKPHLAYLSFCAGLKIKDNNEDIYLLLAKCLSEINFNLGINFIEIGLKAIPTSSKLWRKHWEMTREDQPERRLKKLLNRVPIAIDALEQGILVKEINRILNAPRFIGYIEEKKNGKIIAFCIDRFMGEKRIDLNVETSQRSHVISPVTYEPLDCDDQIINLYKFEIQLSENEKLIDLAFEDGTKFINMPMGATEVKPAGNLSKKLPERIDVLIPVYGAEVEVMRCLEAVRETKKHNKAQFDVIVLDDATPDLSFQKRLKNYCFKEGIIYKRNNENLGFIGTINKGFLLHRDRDVIILNSDTVVFSNWVDRLKTCSNNNANVASVTPLSNFGEMMGFPEIKQKNSFLDVRLSSKIDYILKRNNAFPIELPSGCGFCMYIKRKELEKIGYFDQSTYYLGYGEETDWCLRARREGFIHLGAMNIYVAHEGERSFGVEKLGLANHNNKKIYRSYPEAERQHEKHLKRSILKSRFESIKEAVICGLLQQFINENEAIFIYTQEEDYFSLERNKISIELGIEKDLEIATFYFYEKDKDPRLKLTVAFDQKKIIDIFLSLGGAQIIFTPMSFRKFEEIISDKKYKNYSIKKPLPPKRHLLMNNHISTKIILIADPFIDEKLGKRWKQFLQICHSQGLSEKFISIYSTPWHYEFSVFKNFIYAPPLEQISLKDHLSLSGCHLAISLETRKDHLQDNLWSPDYLAGYAGIAISYPSLEFKNRDLNLCSENNKKLQSILREFADA